MIADFGLRIEMATAVTTRLTAEEFEEVCAEVPFCELERGRVVQLTAGEWIHGRTSCNIACALWQWAKESKCGRVLTNEAGLITERNPDTVRGVDVMYYSYRRMPVTKDPDGFPKVAPELAVEIIGKKQGWGKMLEKAGEYVALGADRVWIVDLKAQSLHVFAADEAPVRYGISGAICDRKILPGFSAKSASSSRIDNDRRPTRERPDYRWLGPS